MSTGAEQPLGRVACVGTGCIGAGWAACFLARGLEVVAWDPAPGAEAAARVVVDQAWPLLERLGLAPGASRARLRFVPTLAEAVAGVSFVQESAPDREQLKIDLFAEIDAHAPAAALLASSSSAFLPTRLQSRCGRPERVLVGHPFAPSYLMPLVEVVGGEHTAPAALERAVNFYRAMAKVPLRLAREIESYIANRLQHAVFQEAASLVRQGICGYEDIDTAMALGPGLRWAFAGPVLCYHLGGGKGGVRHMIEHFGWVGDTAEKEALVVAVERMAGHLSMEELERWRDGNLLALLESLALLPRR